MQKGISLKNPKKISMLPTKNRYFLEINTPDNSKPPRKKLTAKFTPRLLSIIIMCVALILSGLLFEYIRKVFAGEWLLRQSTAFIPNFSLSFLPEIPIGPIDLRFYSLMVTLGVVAAFYLSMYLSSYHYIPETLIDRIFIGMVIFGLLGARAFFVAFHLDHYSKNLLDIINIAQGGMALFGAFIGAGIYLWIYCRQFKFIFFEFTDFLVPGILAGQIIGRFGNFFNYEAFGGPTRVYWSMFVPETARKDYGFAEFTSFHPTFLYEIIPNFILLFFLLFFYKNLTNKRCGLVFALYCIFYGLIRFTTEFFRVDALQIKLNFLVGFLEDIGLNLNVESILISQVLAACMFIFGLFLFVKRSNIIYISKNMQEYR